MMAKAKAKRKTRRPAETEQQRIERLARTAGVPDAQIGRGYLAETTIVDLSGELGGKRMSMAPVIVNRGGTAIDRWIHRDPAGLFGESEVRAVRYAQNLWRRLECTMRAVDPAADVVDAPLGWSQQEALVEIKRLEGRIPPKYWTCFENVVRWDEEAGVAGSRLANNARSAVDAAKTCVAFTAGLIATWRRL